MHLECLPCRQLQRSVSVFPGKLIHDKPLLGRRHSARHPDAQHELICRLKLLLLPLIPEIAVILQIAAVELHQTVVVIGNAGCNRIEHDSSSVPRK